MASVDCPRDCDFEFQDRPEKQERPLRDATVRRQLRQRGLHRIAEVRQQQRITLRNAARRLRLSITDVRRQEQGDCDLSLSQLRRWQEVLGVPVADLLVESEGQLAGPVLERARMVRLMKTAAAIRERTRETPTGRLVAMLIEQLSELMPEVAGVTPWPESGPQRTLDDLGRTARCPVPDQIFRP